jgi:hypothetical protein
VTHFEVRDGVRLGPRVLPCVRHGLGRCRPIVDVQVPRLGRVYGGGHESCSSKNVIEIIPRD